MDLASLDAIFGARSPTWLIAAAMIGALASQYIELWRRRREALKVRIAVSILCFHELVAVLEVLQSGEVVSRTDELLSFDLLIQKGRLETMELDVGSEFLALFRGLRAFWHLQNKREILEGEGTLGGAEVASLGEIDERLERLRIKYGKSVKNLLRLIVKREGRLWRRRTRRKLSEQVDEIC